LFVELSQQLADVSYSASDLAEPAEELALDVRTLASVSAETSDPIFSDRRVQKDLFDSELRESGNNSDLIELADGRAIVFRVEGYNKASDLPLDQVSGEIEALLKNQKSAEFAASVGQAFVVRVEAGEQASAVAEDLGLDWVEYTQIRRDNTELLPELVMNVFAMPEPVGEGTQQVTGFEVNNGDFAIASLARVESGDAELILPVERRSIARTLGSTYGGVDYSSYLVSIENGAEIERL
jgi:peptidyl-prolyl cis-trans isomerase D